MRTLQADAGNTAVKWRLLDGGVELSRGRFLHSELTMADALPALENPLDAVWIASVASPELDERLAQCIHERYGLEVRFATTPARSPLLINSYSDPQRMGIDRWLAMLGARARARQRICVIDAGSALTIDLVAANGRHEGGYILPGFDFMERAMLSDMQRVRFEGSRRYGLLPGTDTRSAVQHGVALALAGAVRLALRQAQESGPPPRLFICGGDGAQLQSLLDLDAEFCIDLVFEGLTAYARERETRIGTE